MFHLLNSALFTDKKIVACVRSFLGITERGKSENAEAVSIALEELNCSWKLFLYYWVTALVTNQDDIFRSFGKKVSTTDDVLGYVYWYLMNEFIIPNVRKGTFYFHDLKIEGNDSAFAATQDAAATRINKYKQLNLIDTTVLTSYFFTSQNPRAVSEQHSQQDNKDCENRSSDIGSDSEPDVITPKRQKTRASQLRKSTQENGLPT